MHLKFSISKELFYSFYSGLNLPTTIKAIPIIRKRKLNTIRTALAGLLQTILFVSF